MWKLFSCVGLVGRSILEGLNVVFRSDEMISERIGLFGGAAEILFLQTIPGSCLLVYDE